MGADIADDDRRMPRPVADQKKIKGERGSVPDQQDGLPPPRPITIRIPDIKGPLEPSVASIIQKLLEGVSGRTAKAGRKSVYRLRKSNDHNAAPSFSRSAGTISPLHGQP
ncbi:hypothetical protein ABC347_17410 [Sphingomonas sp. 1P06PA]|uniref:hypothetical protein n=1 Tax=Sphingomonas sp. 1P06PA TaxID=554121 RepID=UPI0039A66868